MQIKKDNEATTSQQDEAAKDKSKNDAPPAGRPNAKNPLPFEDFLAAKPSTSNASKPPVIFIPEKKAEDLHDFVIDIDVSDSVMRNG